jgi:hypothetical protein
MICVAFTPVVHRINNRVDMYMRRSIMVDVTFSLAFPLTRDVLEKRVIKLFSSSYDLDKTGKAFSVRLSEDVVINTIRYS